MNAAQHNQFASFIWSIANILRDYYARGRYRDIILPMVVVRRLDALLEPTKTDVLQMKASLDEAGIVNQDGALRQAAGEHGFYNTSPFTLKDLKSRGSQQQLEADFRTYLDGFSPNVAEILNCFEFRNQVARLSKANILGTLINSFLDPAINFAPHAAPNGAGGINPGLDNHAMGTVFEELVRRFNEENNEEAGEHWTPRDAVKLMANLIFRPIADQIQSGTYYLYDGACGTGGMLTVGEDTLQELAHQQGKQVSTHLFGQEINAETYAICKADLLLKGDGEAADNIVGGPEYSTLSNDAFRGRQFDFGLSNPPYGKAWLSDLERMGGKDGLTDPRFVVTHDGDPEFSLVTRTSDGQMLFLANLIAKMKDNTPLGSRMAEVHNGSSLFTGDAGQGESNVRRYLIENDWLEAIVALPTGMFYNTGIATYIWVIANRKSPERQGKVQLIDASGWFTPLRKNLGKKNCELSDADIERACAAYLDFKETPQSKIFPNRALGYWKIRVERPLRLHSQLTPRAIDALRFASGDTELREWICDELGEAPFEEFETIRPRLETKLGEWGKNEEGENGEGEPPQLADKKRRKLLDPKTWQRDALLVKAATVLRDELGDGLWEDFNEFRQRADRVLEQHKSKIKLSPADKKFLLRAVSWREETAPPVIAKTHKPGKATPDPLHGFYDVTLDGKDVVVEYESDPELRDGEQVPLLEEGGIEAFFEREVLPYTLDAWIDKDATKIGYEVSFTRYFYQAPPQRSLDAIRSEIEALERETEGLLDEVLVEVEVTE